jgi:hypothetical protein
LSLFGIKEPCEWRAASGEKVLLPETSQVDEGAFVRLRASLDPCWIDAALEATGRATLRRRRLPAEQVVWLVLRMSLYRDRPLDELVERLDLVLPSSGRRAMAKSAVAQARARLVCPPKRAGSVTAEGWRDACATLACSHQTAETVRDSGSVTGSETVRRLASDPASGPVTGRTDARPSHRTPSAHGAWALSERHWD